MRNEEVDAPLLRPLIGCLESLLLAQDLIAWALPQTQVSPRAAIAGLLALAVNPRPKVRKRALEALSKVLANPPPNPSLDHPVADLCAETALLHLRETVEASQKRQKARSNAYDEHQPVLLHALQLVKTVASASGGWPSKKIDSLCELLLGIAKSSNEFLTVAAFEIFEVMFAGMANEISSAKLPRLLEVISDLQPSQNDTQLLPPWIAVLSRAYEVSAQMEPEDTFVKLPEVFEMVSTFLSSMSHNIRVSASECLIGFAETCIPPSVILEPSVYDEKILEKIGKIGTGLLTMKYQAAWMEVFKVLAALFEALKWRAILNLDDVVKAVGELRSNESFNGKQEADVVLGMAVEAMGPESVLSLLPLNLAKPQAGQPGRAWLLPILRDHVSNTNFIHFKTEFVPLSEVMFQKVMNHGSKEKSMEIKIFETVVQQIWSLLPGYCTLPLDLTTAFDQGFAELLANLLYQKTDLRVDICNGLQLLVESNKAILAIEGPEEDMLKQRRISKQIAQGNLNHLATFSGNLLAVLFNVYMQTLPHFRGYILQCLNSYLSITPEKVGGQVK